MSLTPAQSALSKFLSAAQQLYANDGSEAGMLTAQEIGRVLAKGPLPGTGSDPTGGAWTNALDQPSALLEDLLRTAAPCIPWVHAGLDDSKIPSDTARRMLTAELIGPESALHSDLIRLGLFWQDADVSYPARSHAAEECYILLAGQGEWSLGDAPARTRLPGAVIFHPSYSPHASRTLGQPMLALWRWTGEIGWDSYRCTG